MIAPLRLGVLLAAALAPAIALASADALLRGHEVRGWDVVAEAPVLPSMDRDLAEWGVREKHVRHYSRDRHGQIQVCSVELWIFESVEQARAAAAGFSFPDWQIDRKGISLVMVHALSQRRGARMQRSVFAECDRMGARIRDRAG